MSRDNSALLEINQEFMRAMKECSKNSAQSPFMKMLSEISDNSGLEISDDFDPSRQRVSSQELIATKQELWKLQTELAASQQARQKLEIEMSETSERLKADVTRERNKREELQYEIETMQRTVKEEKTRHDEERKQMITTKNTLECNIDELTRNNSALVSQLQELKHLSAVNTNRLQFENNQLKMSLESLEQDLKSTNEQLDYLSSVNKQNADLQMELETVRHELNSAQHDLKAAEFQITNSAENNRIGNIMKEKLEKFDQLKAENIRLNEELQHYKLMQTNTSLLMEELKGLEKKNSRTEERLVDMDRLSVENMELRKKLDDWESLVRSISPSYVSSPLTFHRHLQELQQTNITLLEQTGRLESNIHSLTAMLNDVKSQLEVERSGHMSLQSQQQHVSDTLKRAQRKLLLVSKERDAYKDILNSYESETTVSGDQLLSRRCKQQEEAVQKYRDQLSSLENDFQRLSDTNRKLSTQYQEQLQKSSALSSTQSSTDVLQATTECLQLRNLVKSLQDKITEMTEENRKLSVQLEQQHRQADEDSSSDVRIIHFTNNPFAVARAKQSQELARLRDENRQMRERMKSFDVLQDEYNSKMKQFSDPPPTSKQVEEIKSRLKSAELKNKRLVEAFSKTSQELREACYQLLGYRIDIPSTNQYKLMSLYAESANDYFVFKQTADGEMQMLSTDYSSSFQDKIDHYLTMCKSIPCFLSSVTLELYGRQTMIT